MSNINFRNSERLFEIWLEQELLGGVFSMRFGQLAADVEFFTTQTGAVFLNSDFGALPAISFNATPPIFAAAASGVRLRVNPAKSFYLQAGLYDGNPSPDALGGPTPGFRPGTQYNDNRRCSFNKRSCVVSRQTRRNWVPAERGTRRAKCRVCMAYLIKPITALPRLASIAGAWDSRLP